MPFGDSLRGHIGDIEFTDKKIRNDDGYLHLFLLKEADFWSRLSVITDLIGRQIEANESVQYYAAKTIRISSTMPDVATDIDGDLGDVLPVEVRVLPKALTVYTLREEGSYLLEV